MGIKLEIVLCILIFLLGFVSPYFINSVYSGLEQPFSLNILSQKSAPSETITRDSIQVYDDRLVILIDNATLGRYAPTGSMLPLLDENSKGIRVVPKDEKEISVGDIITYKRGSELIIHRVIEKGQDKDGSYFVLKGDNNPTDDGKVRFSDIVYKTVGVLY